MGKTLHLVSDLLYDEDVNMQYKNGHTLLHYSCATDYKNGVEILLSVFADKEITDDTRRTAFKVAESFDHYEMIKLFSKSSI
jgi:ankyrin repeat protein